MTSHTVAIFSSKGPHGYVHIDASAYDVTRHLVYDPSTTRCNASPAIEAILTAPVVPGGVLDIVATHKAAQQAAAEAPLSRAARRRQAREQG